MKIGTFTSHPAADAFPLIEGPEFDELVADIRTNGLREPIWYWLDPGGKRGSEQLILDGRNRLRACLKGNVKPEFRQYRGKDPVAFVISLNLHRRHLNESQRGMIAARLESVRHGGDRSKTPIGVLNRKDASHQLNVGERTVTRARAVLEKAVPEIVKAVDTGRMSVAAANEVIKLTAGKQRELAKRVEKSKDVKPGHVRALVRQEQRREVVRNINTGRVPPLVGTFRLIVADNPWPYENSDGHEGARGHITYPPMSMEAICELGRDIDKVAHEDCILGLWVTNAFIREVGRVLDAWKFEHQTMITWGKDRLGMGSWPRGKTEHLVIASRGKPVHTLNELTTLMMAPVREHSRKPDEIMDAVAKHCPGPRLEMFAREPRDGWTSWGAEPTKFDASKEAA